MWIHWFPSIRNKSVGGVAAEEGILLPLRARGGVGRFEKQAARKLLVAGGGLLIEGLVYVVGRRVVAIGERVLEDFLLRSAEFEADVHFDCGHFVLDEAELIAVLEYIGQRLRLDNGPYGPRL